MCPYISPRLGEEVAVHMKLMLPSFPWTRALEEGRVQIPDVTYECALYIENAPDGSTLLLAVAST